MIDAIAILVTHTLLLAAFWLLQERDDLDDEAAENGAADGKSGFGWRGEAGAGFRRGAGAVPEGGGPRRLSGKSAL